MRSFSRLSSHRLASTTWWTADFLVVLIARLSLNFQTVAHGTGLLQTGLLISFSRGIVRSPPRTASFSEAECCDSKVFQFTYTGFTRCSGRSPQQCLSDTIAAPWPQVAALSCKARGGHSPLGELPQILNILMDLRCPLHSERAFPISFDGLRNRACGRPFHAAQKHYRADWPLRGHASDSAELQRPISGCRFHSPRCI